MSKPKISDERIRQIAEQQREAQKVRAMHLIAAARPRAAFSR